MLAAGYEPDARDGAGRSCATRAEHLAPYKRIRRLEFAELPKTISGKIRRVELRAQEAQRLGAGAAPGARADGEFWEEDLPELRA